VEIESFMSYTKTFYEVLSIKRKELENDKKQGDTCETIVS